MTDPFLNTYPTDVDDQVLQASYMSVFIPAKLPVASDLKPSIREWVIDCGIFIQWDTCTLYRAWQTSVKSCKVHMEQLFNSAVVPKQAQTKWKMMSHVPGKGYSLHWWWNGFGSGDYSFLAPALQLRLKWHSCYKQEKKCWMKKARHKRIQVPMNIQILFI